jgi:hypothetical protein
LRRGKETMQLTQVNLVADFGAVRQVKAEVQTLAGLHHLKMKPCASAKGDMPEGTALEVEVFMKVLEMLEVPVN